jgi:AraC-like DNA-binding protein
MPSVVKLSDDHINEARPYATAMHRSIPKQIEHWARLGKAAEENPDVGEPKKGDLAGVRVHKYRIDKELMLLAYAANKAKQVVILFGYGTRENFYRDLKH